MFHRLGLRCLLVALALLAPVLVVGTQAVPAQAATAAIKIKPPSGPPTTKVTVSGTGFGASEAIEVDFGATKVATATSSAAGAFSASFKVPASAPPSVFLVTAKGLTSGLSATANFLVRTNWPMLRFGVTGTGYNPYENVIGPANVSSLTSVWTEPSSQLAYEPASPPATVNGVLYTATGLGLYELDAYNPASGALLWHGASITNASGSAHTPAVVNGFAYVASTDGNLYTYSTKATSAHCSGTAPKVCNPVWTASIGGAGSEDQSSVVVTGGVAYVSAGYNLYAFNANGCGAATTCNPLWVSAGSSVDGSSTPTVSGGMVYVAGGSGLHVFSTTVTSAHCSGTAPVTCNPVWIGNGNGASVSDTSPAIAGGKVYLSNSPGFGTLYAFSTSCASATCNPLWTYVSPVAAAFATPAVANGKVYVNTSNAVLNVFSTSGSLLWTAPDPGAGTGGGAAAVVANGVVYAGDRGNLVGSSADGTTGCSGSPKVCTPLWTVTSTGGSFWDTPEIVNGMLFVTNKNGIPLSGYKLP